MPPEFGHAAEPSAAPRCDGSGGTFQTVARRQVRTVRKRRRERTAAVGAGRYIYNGKAAVVRRSAQVEIGTQYTLATLDEPSRCQVGPKILLDRPASTPIPSSIKFPFGLAQASLAGRKGSPCFFDYETTSATE